MVEDALKQAAGLEGSGTWLEGKKDGLEVYQKNLSIVYSQSKEELSAEVEELKKKLDFLLYLQGKIMVFE